MVGITNPMLGRTLPSIEGADGIPLPDIAHDYRRCIGAYIQKRREELRMTQRELGELVGVGPKAISAIEVGRQSPSPELSEEFAHALGLDPKWFGEFLFRWTNPWLYSMIHPENEEVRRDIARFPRRQTYRRPKEQ